MAQGLQYEIVVLVPLLQDYGEEGSFIQESKIYPKELQQIFANDFGARKDLKNIFVQDHGGCSDLKDLSVAKVFVHFRMYVGTE